MVTAGSLGTFTLYPGPEGLREQARRPGLQAQQARGAGLVAWRPGPPGMVSHAHPMSRLYIRVCYRESLPIDSR